MTEEARKAIERNVIANRAVAVRLRELVSRHCVNRNVRQHGRTVEIVREWFADYLYGERSDDEVIALLTRGDVLSWAEALMAWPGWEGFLARVMAKPGVVGLAKVCFLRLGVALHDVPRETPCLEQWRPGRHAWCFLNEADPELCAVIGDEYDKSDVRILMEADMAGLEWTWDRVEWVGMTCRGSLLAALLENKLDEIAEVATPDALAALSIEGGDWDMKSILRSAKALTDRWPGVYEAYYLRRRALFTEA